MILSPTWIGLPRKFIRRFLYGACWRHEEHGTQMFDYFFAKTRLISGLVLFTYIFMHLGNHALGLISIEWMEAGRQYLVGPWQWLPLAWVLPLAVFMHVVNACLVVARRRNFRLPAWQWLQVLLGFSIPLLMLPHLNGTWVARYFDGIAPSYGLVLASHFFGSAIYLPLQVAGLLVAWVHGVLGLAHWFKLFRNWLKWRNAFMIVSGVWPALALSGYLASGRSLVERVNFEPEELALIAEDAGLTPEIIADLTERMNLLYGLALVIVMGPFVVAMFSVLFRSFQPRGTVATVQGEKILVLRGSTLLDALHLNGISHPSVCGGRARCTTCRVKVVHGNDCLPEPSELEQKALTRIKAPQGMRLACQIRPIHPLTISSTVPRNAKPIDGRRPGGLEGREIKIVCLFLDLRGSTTLGESRLPFDILFLLNQFFGIMTDALLFTKGHYSQFTGDGLMAIYGMDGSDQRRAARRALVGAHLMMVKLSRLNEVLSTELPKPLEIGIGIHFGEAIVGRMGPPNSQIISAIGDTVNTTARLEALTKEHGKPVVVSRALAEIAGISIDEREIRDVPIRGRSENLDILPFMEIPADVMADTTLDIEKAFQDLKNKGAK